MPHMKYFAQNGDLVKAAYEELSEDNLAAYVAMHSSERAAGYLEAIADFIKAYNELGNYRGEFLRRTLLAQYLKSERFIRLPAATAIFDRKKEGYTIPELP